MARFVDHQLAARPADVLLTLRSDTTVAPPYVDFYRSGLAQLRKLAKAKGAASFSRLSPSARHDLAAFMQRDVPADARAEAWAATRDLLDALSAAGARHHDFNVKNVLLAPAGRDLVAWILDVDRVEFGHAPIADVRAANQRRLLRSARKWRDQRGALFDDRELVGGA